MLIPYKCHYYQVILHKEALLFPKKAIMSDPMSLNPPWIFNNRQDKGLKTNNWTTILCWSSVTCSGKLFLTVLFYRHLGAYIYDCYLYASIYWIPSPASPLVTINPLSFLTEQPSYPAGVIKTYSSNKKSHINSYLSAEVTSCVNWVQGCSVCSLFFCCPWANQTACPQSPSIYYRYLHQICSVVVRKNYRSYKGLLWIIDSNQGLDRN